MRVFVLDTNRTPLDPCTPARARKLLRKGRAAVFRRQPFTIIVTDQTVIVLTKDAIRDDRRTPVLRDRIRAFPDIPPARHTSRRAAQKPPTPEPHSRPERSPGRARRSSKAQEVLQAVVSWARAHRRDLMARDVTPLGQWEARVGNTPVLLIRAAEGWTLLGQYADDARGILQAWKDSGILVTSGAPSEARQNRSTIFVHAPKDRQRGARYMAFRWEALEQAGLRRDGQSGEPGSTEAATS